MAAVLTALGLVWANPIVDDYYLDTPQSLSLPPEAASVALAGALAGAGPGVAAAFYNPAALAGLPRTEAAASWGPWGTELWPGMSHAWAGFGFPAGKRLCVGIDASFTPRGEVEMIDEHGEYVGSLLMLDATLGSRAALALGEHCGVGAGLKLFLANSAGFPYQHGQLSWPMPPGEATATSILADAGVLWTPSRRGGLGLSLCNAGPDIHYAAPDIRANWTAVPPWTVRLGGRLRMVEFGATSVDLLAQVDGSVAPHRDWVMPEHESHSFMYRTARAIALDGLFWNFLSLRLGYMDGPTNDRYGVTAGIGLRLWDVLRIDLASDALTYTYMPRRTGIDWRLSIASSNLAGLWRRR